MEHGTTVKLPEADRKYKDTIFRWLFSDRENLLSLYNAVTGRSCGCRRRMRTSRESRIWS